MIIDGPSAPEARRRDQSEEIVRFMFRAYVVFEIANGLTDWIFFLLLFD